jgi:hypothetical protein
VLFLDCHEIPQRFQSIVAFVHIDFVCDRLKHVVQRGEYRAYCPTLPHQVRLLGNMVPEVVVPFDFRLTRFGNDNCCSFLEDFCILVLAFELVERASEPVSDELVKSLFESNGIRSLNLRPPLWKCLDAFESDLNSSGLRF